MDARGGARSIVTDRRGRWGAARDTSCCGTRCCVWRGGAWRAGRMADRVPTTRSTWADRIILATRSTRAPLARAILPHTTHALSLSRFPPPLCRNLAIEKYAKYKEDYHLRFVWTPTRVRDCLIWVVGFPLLLYTVLKKEQVHGSSLFFTRAPRGCVLAEAARSPLPLCSCSRAQIVVDQQNGRTDGAKDYM